MSDSNTIFIAADNKRVVLEAVAQDVFAALGITEFEERFSSNYPPNEHYFAGYAENVVIDVFDFDEVKPGYIYSLSIDKPTYRKGKKHAPASAATIAEMLAKAGFRVFVPIGPWYTRGMRVRSCFLPAFSGKTRDLTLASAPHPLYRMPLCQSEQNKQLQPLGYALSR